MFDESNHSSSGARVDETGRVAVLAHSMLGTVTAIRGAIDLAMADESVGPGRDSLMLMAVHRLEFLTRQLHDLAAGTPSDFPAAVRVHPSVSGDLALRRGRTVELYSAFNHTWTTGFEIADIVEHGYRIRRASDGSLLPGHTSPDDLRVHDDRRSR
jgi:hypothetical protein